MFPILLKKVLVKQYYAFLIILFISGSPEMLSATTVISFEDIVLSSVTGGASVVYQYSPTYGIIFGNATCVDDNGTGYAHSGRKYVEACWGVESCSNPITMRFRADQTRVKIWVGYSGRSLPSQITVILRAFNSAGTQIGQATSKLGPSSGTIQIRTPLELSLSGINHITVGFLEAEPSTPLAFNNFFDIDDVEFDGPPPPPCATTPVVNITAPNDGVQFDILQTTVTGSISGDNIPDQCLLEIINLQPAPHDQSPSTIYSVILSGSGNLRTFSKSVNLKLGYQSLKVSIINDCGYAGQASVNVTYLPPEIRARYNTEGSAEVGNLQWTLGCSECTCQIAVYQKMAIASVDGNDLVIKDGIFDKWKAWVAKPYHETAPNFCPLYEEDESNWKPWIFQEFGSGAIMSEISNNNVFSPIYTSYFIPRPFIGALLPGHFPLSDPLTCPATNTWIFQQFSDNSQSNEGGFTLELKGEPPKLWREQMGASQFAQRHQWGKPLETEPPTISYSSKCSNTVGPCLDIQLPKPGGRLLGQICNSTFPWEPWNENREWEPVINDKTLTPVYGVLLDSHRSDQDLTTTHAHNYNDQGLHVKWYSDWSYILAPLYTSDNLLGGNDNLELEIEIAYLSYFRNLTDEPKPGDLFFACGRWICDCGHHFDQPFGYPSGYYATEIHPPAVMAYMRTEENDHPVTAATIYVDGFYTGVPVEIDLFPPPRPAPNAIMLISKPRDSEAAVGVNIEYEIDRDWSTYVHVLFNAPLAYPGVYYGGRMSPLTGREYYGKWTIGWEIDPNYKVSDFDY